MNATHLLKNADIVITVDAAGELRDCDILVVDGRIAAIGSDLQHPDAVVTDCSGHIVAPGLVNAHLHSWQTILRSIGADWTGDGYTREMHRGMAPFFMPSDLHWSTYLGALTQLQNGVTTLVDWCHNNPTPAHSDAAVEALQQSGIRAVFMHGSPKPDVKPGQRHWSEIPQSRAEIERLARLLSISGSRVSLGLAILGPHYSTYDVTVQDLQLAGSMGLIASMHVGGPVPISPDGWGRLQSDGLLSRNMNIVHGQSLTESELDALVAAGASFTPTPEGEMLQEHGFPILGRILSRDGRLSLGTDIESCNGNDMFTAARIGLAVQRALDGATALARGEALRRVSVSCRDALEWMTIGGASMLGMESEIGSIRVGKRADLILLRQDLNLWPIHDPVQSFVMQASTRNIDKVFVGGELMVDGGHVVAGDVDVVRRNALLAGQRLASGRRSS